jgi:hypothetical protein
LNLARFYVAAALSVIPIRVDGSKAPALASWTEYQSRRPTDAELVCWFGSEVTGMGIAIVCGAVSGRLEVIDFDSVDLFETWLTALRNESPALIPGLTVISTPEGRHVYLRLAGPVPRNRRLARDKAGKTLIETRGEGGYVLAPGCPTSCHPTGGLYQHFSGPPLDQLASLDGYESLIDSAKSLNEFVKPRRFESQLPASANNGTPAGLRPGDDFNNRATWGELLTPRKWVPTGTRDGLTYWRRPGKPAPGMSATTGIRSECGLDLLYVFSTNALPFEAETSYSKFSAYALLEHRGDFQAAAAALAGAGYGDPDPHVAAGTELETTTAEVVEDGADRGFKPLPWPAPLGKDALHGLAGDVVYIIAPHTESDPAALLVQFLTIFGNACGRHAYYQVEARSHYTNLYVVMVGKTAKGRKGTSYGWIESLFLEAVVSGWLCRVKAGLSSGEGLIWNVRDAIHKREPIRDKKTKKVTEYQDVIIDQGESDKRLLIVEEEFASPIKQMSREGNTLSPVLRQGWDGGRLSSLTKNSPAKATDAHVSCIAHITKEELLRYLSSTEQANGFANRFLWVCTRRSKLLPDGGSGVDLSSLRQRIKGALDTASTLGEMKRSDDAAQLWRAEYPTLSRERPGLLGLVTNRAEAQVLRLSIIYALLDKSNKIDTPHLRAALAVWAYVERSCAWIYGASTGNPDADEILAALKKAGDAGMNLTQISGIFRNNRRAAEIHKALGLLVDMGLVTPGRAASGQRPAENWKATGESTNATNATNPPDLTK